MGTAVVDDGREKVQLQDRLIDKYLLECVTIEETALDEEFIRLPSDLAYWNECYGDAIHDHLLAKLDAERARAAISIELREVAADSGQKLTVADLDARVVLDPRVQKAEIRLVEAESQRQALRLRCEAIMAKRDMLQSLGAKVRAEMSDPAIREQHIGHKLTRR